MTRTPPQNFVSSNSLLSFKTPKIGDQSRVPQSPSAVSSIFPSLPPIPSSSSFGFRTRPSPLLPYAPTASNSREVARLLFPERATSPIATSEGHEATYLAARTIPDREKEETGGSFFSGAVG